MEELSTCPDTDWFTKTNGSEENNKLELTLALPGPQKWSTSTITLKHSSYDHETHDSLLSLAHHHHHHHQTSWSVEKESFLQQCSNISTEMAELQQIRNDNDSSITAEKIGFLPSVSQKRIALGPAVGWPPVRSFRKNLTTSNGGTKPYPQAPPEAEPLKEKHPKKATETTTTSPVKGLFVKINMDGIPIGRKVDLNAYDNYEKLAFAVDNLFRGLLAAQTETFINEAPSNLQVGNPITGLLDGSGEYTLVYEDNEGDRVLVGDVPWRMFVSTVKRLRVLKTSELPSLRRKYPESDDPLTIYLSRILQTLRQQGRIQELYSGGARRLYK